MTKRDRLKIALITFKGSDKTTDDYIDLFVGVKQATAQGDGLLWSTVREDVNTYLEEARHG